MICTIKMSENVEIVSNIQRKKIALNVRRDGLQPSIFVRSFSAITKREAQHSPSGNMSEGSTSFRLKDRKSAGIVAH